MFYKLISIKCKDSPDTTIIFMTLLPDSSPIEKWLNKNKGNNMNKLIKILYIFW